MSVPVSALSRLRSFKSAVKSAGVASNLLTRITSRMSNVTLYSTANPAPAVSEQPKADKPVKKISKAMAAYLERAKAYDIFIQQERQNYAIGKRHLANMMGEDPEFFTQKDVERALEYLMPSGLYDKAARPVMKPPEEMFPPRKDAEFDETGRPFHSMFYTAYPNFYKTLYDIVEQMQILNAHEDERIRKGIAVDPNISINLTASDWISHKELEKLLLEKVRDSDYEYFIATMDRLTAHPEVKKVEDFVMKFRKQRKALTQSFVVPELQRSEDGRPFITVPDCMRKNARGSVTVTGNGSGKITVNGQPMVNYFKRHQDYEQIVFPLTFTDMLDSVDVDATVRLGGPTGQSGAIRWGIAWALRSFVTLEMVEKMRIAGLLTRDWRRRERKKPGQRGARRKFTWHRR